jgi:hypothetical protein
MTDVRCVICGHSDGDLKALTKRGLSNILNSSLQRKDGKHHNINVDNFTEYYVHNSCRAVYTDKRKIKKHIHVSSGEKTDCLITSSTMNNPIWNVDSSITDAVVSTFDFESRCFICGHDLGRYHETSAVSRAETQGKLLEVCDKSSDKQAASVKSRIDGVDLLAVGARYHRKCYKTFTKNTSQVQKQWKRRPMEDREDDCGPVANSNSDATTDVQLMQGDDNSGIGVWSVTNCGPARSHAEYLRNVAVANNVQLRQTLGGGDCFFHAVQMALHDCGIDRTVRELRQLAAIEMRINAQLYRPLYRREDFQQAATYERFVAMTDEANEWATEVTVAAMARGLDFGIRVVSTTNGSDGQPTAFVKDYTDGVSAVHRMLIVGYNVAEGHYVGFSAQAGLSEEAEATVATVARHVSRMSIEDDTDADRTLINRYRRMSVEADDVFVQSPNEDEVPSQNFSEDRSCRMSEDRFETFQPAGEDLASEPQLGSSSGRQCANCKRVESGEFHMLMTSHSGHIIRRAFCRIPVSDSDRILCHLCLTYLTTHVPQSRLWQCGWPSVISSLLSDRKNVGIQTSVWKFLPDPHREAWRELAIDSGVDVDSGAAAAFQDYTSLLQTYDTMIKSGKPGDFISAMDKFAFPCVKCPAGCFAYVDQCQLLAFNHFLHWKLEVSIMGGDSKRLKGARIDWPSTSLQLKKFTVSPGVVVDADKGLCILLCDYHGSGLAKPVIHVPRNPVLGDLGLQYPDRCAAAILTPNVIRAGRMGKWTNSSHVVAAVGGYSGISSSSLALDVDINVVDTRLAAAQCLAMTHRSDIYHICRDRYSDIPDGDVEFHHMLDDYNKRLKPSQHDELTAVEGSTFVDLSDAFSVNDRLVKHFTKDDSSMSHRSKFESWQLSTVLVHTTHPGGHAPVSLTSVYKPAKHTKTGALINIVIYCPPAQQLILRSFEANANTFTRRLLQYCQYAAGQAKNKSGIKNADACEKLIEEELLNRQLPRCEHESVSVVSLLCCMSDKFVVKAYSEDRQLLDLLSEADAEVLVIFCTGRRSSSQSIPHSVHNLHLMTVLGGENLTNVVVFRWNERFALWQVNRQDRQQTQSIQPNGEVLVPNWRILIYTRSRNVDYMNEQVTCSLNMQRRFRCDIHDTFLVKQPVTCQLQCCVRKCSRKARWACTARGQSCLHAVCWTHGRDLLSDDSVTDVEYGMSGRILRKSRTINQTEAVNLEPSQIIPDESSDCESDDCYDLDPRVLAPIDAEDIVGDAATTPVHSRQDIIPIYQVNRNLPGHYLWNLHYNIMRRPSRYYNVAINAMISHIVTATNCPSVSLLYPEAQLFPRIFWCDQLQSPLGAIPSFLLNKTGRDNFGMASLSDHHNIRMLDGDILTSRENIYWHYFFDLKLNMFMNVVPSKLVFKRGLEILDDNAQSATREQRMPMSETEAIKRIKELASLLKKGKWHYFLTLTVNDAQTPGVRKITEAIKAYADGDEEIEMELTDSFLPLHAEGVGAICTYISPRAYYEK